MNDGFDVIFNVCPQGNDRLNNRNALSPHDFFEHAFIHAHGGAKHACANVGHIGHLEQALKRAIFAIRTVQNREVDIHIGQFFQGLAFVSIANNIQTGPGGVWLQGDGLQGT